MARTSPRAALFAVLAAATALVVPVPVSAELTVEDRLFEPQPQNSWGVDGLDPGSGNFQYYSPVFALEEVGDTMITGGKFLEVTNGVETHAQPYLAAFDVETGDWVPTFTPDVTWSVFDLASDPARNRVFVGGEFPSVNGDSSASGFAALNPTTGALDPTFDVEVGTFGGSQPRVHALEVADDYLYIGGYFSWIRGADGQQVQVSRLARVSLATGIVDSNWTPPVSGGSVWEIVVDQVRGRVLLGGTFSTVNTTATAAFAMVETSDGSLSDYDTDFGLFYYGQGTYSFASAMAVTDDRLLIGGQRHRLVVTDLDLNVISVHVTNRYNAENAGRGGDIQAIEVSGDVAFVACHCWGQINRELPDKTPTDEFTDVRSVYAVDITTGELLDWFQPDFSGVSGPWALRVDRDDCLWVGTDAVQSGQQTGRGVIKLCEADNLAARPGVSATLINTDGTAENAAVNAIDSDYRTNAPIASGFAVSLEGNTPHLDIDLGAVRSVDDVILWARTDAERLDLRNVHVWASPTPFESNAWQDLRNDPDVTEIERLGDHGKKRTLTLPVNVEARYIRIEADFRDLGVPKALQLAEVAVTGQDLPPTQPISVESTYQSANRIVLKWDPKGPVDIYRDDVLIGSDSDGWYTDQNLESGTTFDYRVVTPAGAEATVSASTSGGPPAVELTVTSTYQSRERVVLKWTPKGDVEIYRDDVLVGTDSDGWYTDRDLEPGTTYTYRIESPAGTSATTEATTLD